MSDVGKAPKLSEATPPSKNDGSSEDDKETTKTTPKGDKGKRKAVELTPKVSVDKDGDVGIERALTQNI